jgi:hypothetical protein
MGSKNSSAVGRNTAGADKAKGRARLVGVQLCTAFAEAEEHSRASVQAGGGSAPVLENGFCSSIEPQSAQHESAPAPAPAPQSFEGGGLQGLIGASERFEVLGLRILELFSLCMFAHLVIL